MSCLLLSLMNGIFGALFSSSFGGQLSHKRGWVGLEHCVPAQICEPSCSLFDQNCAYKMTIFN